MSNVISLDDYRELEDIIKLRLGCKNIVFAAMSEDGETVNSYISLDMSDIDLVYAIQTLKDRRRERVSNV